MLKLISLLMVLVYFAVLLYLKFYKEPKSKKVLLVIKENVEPVNVEWIIYSFNRFFNKYFSKTQWWVHLERGNGYYEKRKIVRRHAGKFGYRVFERYYRPEDYVAIFFARPKGNAENWEYQMKKNAVADSTKAKDSGGKSKLIN